VLHDAQELQEGAVLEADVCIVGGGAAGITLALELKGSGLRVCLLESGGLAREPAYQDLYAGRNTGIDAHLLDARSRRFGGTTDKWAGWCRPLEPEDLQRQAWQAPECVWPLTHAELLPCLRRAQRTCQGGAYDYDAQGLSTRAGRPLLPLDPALVRTVVYQYSAPIDFGKVYRSELEQAEDVAIWLHANLVDIELQGNGASVRELRGATLGGRRFVARARRYVLTMGGIEIPRVLLAANRQQQAGVANASGLVGKGWMEHPHYYAGAFLLFNSPPDLSFYTKKPTLTLDDEHPAGETVRVMGALALASQLRLSEGLPTLACSLSRVEPNKEGGLTGCFDARVVEPLLRGLPDGRALVAMTIRAEQRPLASSEIRLSNERDALGLPRIDMHWQVAEEDLGAVYRSLEIIGAAMGRSGLGRLWMPCDAQRSYAPTDTEGGGHHMGATVMSESPVQGVVDRDCRVHGMADLYIASSSVFPSVGFANPTLTIVALAHRLADHLKEAR